MNIASQRKGLHCSSTEPLIENPLSRGTNDKASTRYWILEITRDERTEGSWQRRIGVMGTVVTFEEEFIPLCCV